ncbi:MAG TPA: glutaredoxin family protein [Casimicrobiaceae bacterium]|nr:glutaredoxin family protein [Casimicrobiaceae bacterium]
MNRTTLLRMLALAAASLPLIAHGEMLYRYLDPTGRVVYSDQPPPPTAKGVEPKRLPQNVIETDPVPFAAREAAEKYPVTLYTFDCEVCKQGEALLAKRGVPFKSVIVSEEAGHAKLVALTGQQSAPVLQVGEKQVMTGFNATRWNQLLDEAGYPKDAPRQVARSSPANRPGAAAPNAASGAPETPAAAPPARGTDYPK